MVTGESQDPWRRKWNWVPFLLSVPAASVICSSFSEWTRFRFLNGHAFAFRLDTLLCSNWTRFCVLNGHEFVFWMDTNLCFESTRFRVLNGHGFVVGMETLLCSEWTRSSLSAINRFRGPNGHAFVICVLKWTPSRVCTGQGFHAFVDGNDALSCSVSTRFQDRNCCAFVFPMDTQSCFVVWSNWIVLTSFRQPFFFRYSSTRYGKHFHCQNENDFRMKTISSSECKRFCYGRDEIEFFLLFSFSLIYSFSGGQQLLEGKKMVMDTYSCCEWTGPTSVFRIVVVE